MAIAKFEVICDNLNLYRKLSVVQQPLVVQGLLIFEDS